MTAQYRILRSADSGAVILPRVRLAVSFWAHFRGLMFVPRLPDTEGLLFVRGRESRSDTSLHMLFMRFSIAAVWLDKEGQVVDKQLAKPWRLAYVPSRPAQYFLEANTNVLDRVHVGERLRFDEVTT